MSILDGQRASVASRNLRNLFKFTGFKLDASEGYAQGASSFLNSKFSIPLLKEFPLVAATTGKRASTWAIFWERSGGVA